jgi:PAS domain S-box-containing protein
MAKTVRSYYKRLTKLYIISLAVVALVAISGQLLIQSSLEKENYKHHLVSIAEKQRLRVHTIAETALLIQVEQDSVQRRLLVANLHNLIIDFKQIQHTLQQENIQLTTDSAFNRQQIQLFASLEPSCQQIWNISERICQVALTDSAQVVPLVKDLLFYKARFVEWMDTVLYRYADETLKQISSLKEGSWMLLIILLASLFIKAVLIFRPFLRKATVHFDELMDSLAKARELNKELQEVTQQQQHIQCQLKTALEYQHALFVQSQQDQLELTEHQKMIAAITQATPDVLYLFDLQINKIVYANKEVSALLGYYGPEVGRFNEGTLYEIVHPDDLAQLYKDHELISNAPDAEVITSEFRIRHFDGHYVWLQIRRVIFARNAQGQPTQFLALAQDITEKRHFVEGLLKSESLYRPMIENVNEGIYEIDPKGYFTYVNPVFERISGYSSAELRSLRFWRIVKITEKDKIIRHYNEKIKSRSVSDYLEFPIITKDGNELWVGHSITFEYENDQLKVTRVISWDLSKLKAAQETSLRAQELFEATPDFMWMSNADGGAYLNRSGRRMLGYSDQATISSYSVDNYYPEGALEQIKTEAIPFAIENGVWAGETTLLTQHGKELPVSQLIIAHKNDDGSLKYLSIIARDISDITSSRQEMESMHTLIFGILDSSLSGIMALKALRNADNVLIDFGVLLLNKQVEAITGIPSSALTGKRLREVYPAFLDKELFALYKQVVESGQSAAFEKMLTIRQEQTWLQFVVVKMDDGCVITFSDITLRKKAESQLEQQKEFYESILNLLPADIAVFDEQQRYTFVNASSIKDDKMRQWILGKDDLAYTTFRGKDKTFAERRQGYFQKALLHRKLVEWEEQTVGEGNEQIYFMRRMQAIFNRDGSFRMVIGYGVNITDRKKIINELQEQKELIRQVIDTNPNLISVKGWNGEFILANKALAENYGTEAEKLVGKTDFDFYSDQDEAAASLESDRNFFRKMIKSLDSPTLLFEKEIKNITTGEYKWYQVIKTPLVRHDGTPQLLSIATDISHIKKTEEELIRAKEEAVQSMKAKEMFLSNMSHEIRTPMNAVIGMTHLLLQESPRPDQQECLNTLKFAGENLLVLINDILDFNKIESGKIAFEEIDFNIHDLLQGVIQSLAFKADEKAIAINLHLDHDLPKLIVGDPVRLNQILTNLVSNAVKFTEEGGVQVEVVVGEETDQQVSINFTITDTGIGIAADKIDYIFETFTQASTETTRRFGGTGLGLAITKRLLELQNSQIQVESQEGVGSTFFFRLSFKKSTSLALSSHKARVEVMDRNLTHVRLLLVEDNKANQLVASKFLRKWGIEPAYAVNGQIAVDMVQKYDYDIILMDLQMPEMDGYQATKAIRSLASNKAHTPIIALTASAMLDVKDKVYIMGMNDYISKPFNPNELYAKIARYVHHDEEAPLVMPGITPATQTEILAVEPPASVIINYRNVEEIAMGDTQFMQEITNTFIHSFKTLPEEYAQALLKKDLESVRAVIHKVQPTLLTLELDMLIKELNDGKLALERKAGFKELKVIASRVNQLCQLVSKEIVKKQL